MAECGRSWQDVWYAIHPITWAKYYQSNSTSSPKLLQGSAHQVPCEVASHVRSVPANDYFQFLHSNDPQGITQCRLRLYPFSTHPQPSVAQIQSRKRWS